MILLLPLLLASTAATASPPPSALSPRALAWWQDIRVLADDNTEGRLTGSAGYLRAAEYVERRFKAEGLAPAGEAGSYRQSVALVAQSVDQSASRAELIGGSAVAPLPVGQAMLIGAGGGPRPQQLTAPLVFIGYGLHLPELGHDDFAGVDLKGKIAVVISGGPVDLPGTVKAAARFDRAAFLGRAGAVGIITLTTPKQVEIPWERLKLLSSQPGMYLADASLRDTPDGFLTASIDPDDSERLFEGSGRSFKDLAALADQSAPLPSFPLARSLKVQIAASLTSVSSPNLIAKLEGSDPALRGQYVAVSAHLDHLGVGAPIGGDRIYNGAMDDASGVASVLDIAHQLRTSKAPLRRSVLFVVVTAEEKGLLGSHYLAARPTTLPGVVVADLNFDMPLPLWPLTSVIAQGADESTLGDDARAAAAASGLGLAPDPLPDRNSFIRTDQFSFVRQGVPSLAFKFGFAKGTPEFQIEHDWRTTRYHAPSDDVLQPGVLKEEAVRLDAYVAKLLVRVANQTEPPSWEPNSVFRRYAVK
jgi:Zn-dependent M28 family amino/carboxypeptidase